MQFAGGTLPSARRHHIHHAHCKDSIVDSADCRGLDPLHFQRHTTWIARPQFAVTLGPCPRLDAASAAEGDCTSSGGQNVAFGRLIRGFGLLRHLERAPVCASGGNRPLQTVRLFFFSG